MVDDHLFSVLFYCIPNGMKQVVTLLLNYYYLFIFRVSGLACPNRKNNLPFFPQCMILVSVFCILSSKPSTLDCHAVGFYGDK